MIQIIHFVPAASAGLIVTHYEDPDHIAAYADVHLK